MSMICYQKVTIVGLPPVSVDPDVGGLYVSIDPLSQVAPRGRLRGLLR